jgi:hypothetical protein
LKDGYCVIDENLRPQIVAMFEDYINYDSKYVQEKNSIKNRKTLMDRISHPAMKEIVGEQLYLRANKVRENRRCVANSSANHLNRTEVLFEGLLFHKCCQRKLYLNRDSRSKNNAHIYRCKYCRGNGSTVKKSFSGKRLDRFLENQILQILDDLNHDKLIEKYNGRCMKKLAVMDIKLRELTLLRSSKQQAMQKAQMKLEDYILNGAPDITINAVSSMIHNITNELSDIEKQLNTLRSELETLHQQSAYQEALVADILKAKSIFKSATIAQKKAILQLLINRIEVSDTNEADIFLNI